jgi:hypothetical protein
MRVTMMRCVNVEPSPCCNCDKDMSDLTNNLRRDFTRKVSFIPHWNQISPEQQKQKLCGGRFRRGIQKLATSTAKGRVRGCVLLLLRRSSACGRRPVDDSSTALQWPSCWSTLSWAKVAFRRHEERDPVHVHRLTLMLPLHCSDFIDAGQVTAGWRRGAHGQRQIGKLLPHPTTPPLLLTSCED